MTIADPVNVFACRCLNVRIRVADTPSGIRGNDSQFNSVYVADEGLTIACPQTTLRTRSRGVPVSNTDRCTRYVTLSCLLCQTVVYRVSQTIPLDIEGKEGPMLPTDDWTEQETLKSASGWIELHNECMTGKDISTAENSSSYSTLFSVVLPTPSLPSSEHNPEPPYIPSSPSPPTYTPNPFLLDLKPIFPPPPFTPSHPAFVHLSSLAASKSEAVRKDAEAYLAELVKKKVTDIEKAEAELRRHVEALWRAFRDGVEKVVQEKGARSTGTRCKDNCSWQDGVEAVSSKPSPAVVTVRDFNPIPSPRRVASPTPGPRMSSLSASLATTSFHHPKAQLHQGKRFSHEVPVTNESTRFSPPYLSDPSSSLSSKSYSSLSSQSSKSMSIRANVNGPTYLEPFKRNMDQTNDMATSFRYFTILEADTARTQQKTGEAVAEAVHDAVAKVIGEAENGINESNMESSNAESHWKTRSKSGDRKRDKEANDISPKGKRKVTFDVRPDVATIKSDAYAEKKDEDAEEPRIAEEMIFDLEDEGSERGISNPLLSLNESLHIPSRPSRTRVAGGASLPSSLSSLRPNSLPVPSAVRPPRVLETPEDASQSMRAIKNLDNFPRGYARGKKSPSDDADSEDHEPLDSREAEILKLVAADTPSHRGAWKKDSRAWQLFVRRQGGKVHQRGLIPEETEDDNFGKYMDNDSGTDSDSNIQTGSDWVSYKPTDIATSLPISMKSLSQPKESLSLASYQPKTSLSDKPGVLVPALQPRSKPISSAAWRKAAYAARDRNRSRDPGPLDFAADEDDDEHEEDEDEMRIQTDQDGKGRLRALKILQVRSEVPASGMWRSLA